MKLSHVVVDGSNIATEGRETPSLAQLDEAVQAFIREFEPERVTVVVDATFPNRINRKERQVYEDAVAAGEVITPPAGAIGRGDAFVLQIADRAGATILSNDSFQEFHGDYAWLFDKGRLVGGKPVPHVGWVFMDRAPVRGPASRRAVSEARRGKPKEAAPAERAKSGRAAQATTSDKAKKSDKASKSMPGKAQAELSSAAGTADAELSSQSTAAPAKRRRSRRGADEAATVTSAQGSAPVEPAAAPAKRRRFRRGADEAATVTSAQGSAPVEPAAAPAKRRRFRRGADKGETGQAEVATVPAPATQPVDTPAPAEPVASVADVPDAAAAPEYNEPGPYGDFLSKHPVGSDVEAVVESFGSHGAYLRCGSIRAYAPLKNLADPAPRSAKEVLKAGESRMYVVAEVDRARRGVDLALAETPVAKAAIAAGAAEKVKPARATKATKAAKAATRKKAAKPEQAAKKTAKAAQPKQAAKKAGRSAKKAAAKPNPEGPRQ